MLIRRYLFYRRGSIYERRNTNLQIDFDPKMLPKFKGHLTLKWREGFAIGRVPFLKPSIWVHEVARE
jgi:hypothetical protein